MAAFLVLVSAVGIFYNLRTEQTLSRQGSRGEEVKQIQQVLKNQGYYTGNIDGIFGSQTLEAVKKYQKANGLAVDGIAGPKTLEKMGISSSSGNDNPSRDKNLELLAHVIYAESRGEPYIGQVAVGAVILNRVKHPSFPNTVSGVIYQKNAFETVSNGQINLQPDATAYRAAEEALNGYDPTNGCIYFYAIATTTNKFMLSRPVMLTVGGHNFAK